MPQEPLHIFSFILFTGGSVAIIVGFISVIHTMTSPFLRPSFQAVGPFLSMILGGFLLAFLGWRGLINIPTPKTLEIEAPADSAIRAEVIRNGQIIHREEI